MFGLKLATSAKWIPAYAGMTILFPFSRFIVSGHSMQPGLNPGQQVLTFNWAYIFSNPKVREIIFFKRNDQVYIKRIEKINGSDIFVIGDNKQDSEDSRKFGAISKKDILGKVIYVLALSV